MKAIALCPLLALALTVQVLADGGAASPPPAAPDASVSAGNPGACTTAAVLAAAIPTLGGIGAHAVCNAQCDGTVIWCQGATCSAADRNCNAGQQGFVQCDGVWTFCSPPCPSVCGDGTCDPGEDEHNCPADCGCPFLGGEACP